VNSFVCYTEDAGGISPPPNEENVLVPLFSFFLRIALRFTMYKVYNTQVYK
jgi:hypothetical protein